MHRNTQIVLPTVFSCDQILFYHFSVSLRKCIFADGHCCCFLWCCRILVFRKAAVVQLSHPFYVQSLGWCPGTLHNCPAADVLKRGTDDKILRFLTFRFSICNCYFSITITSYLSKCIDKAVCFRGQGCYFRHSMLQARCCLVLRALYCVIQSYSALGQY